MKCENFNEYINLYLDGLISEKQTEELNEHIKICEKCREEFTIMKNAKKVIECEEEKELPENFHKELMKKIGEIDKTEKKIIKFPVFKVAAVAAAFAITVFACYNFTSDDFNKGVDISGLENKKSVETVENEKAVSEVKITGTEKQVVPADAEPLIKKEILNQTKEHKKIENNTKDEINYKTAEIKTTEPSETVQQNTENEKVQENTAVTTSEAIPAPAFSMDMSIPENANSTLEEGQKPEDTPDAVNQKNRASSGSSAGGGGGSASAEVSVASIVSETQKTMSASEVLSSLGFGECTETGVYRFDISRYSEVMNALSAEGVTDYSITIDDTTKTFTVTCN